MSILIKIFATEERVKEFTRYFEDCDIEVREFHKHSECFATRRAEVDNQMAEYFPEVAGLIDNYEFVQEGFQDYTWGFSALGPIVLIKYETVENDMAKEFNELLSHLNAEENELALHFAARWVPAKSTIRKEVEDV